MADIAITALVSRSELSLADLNIDDDVNYRLGANIDYGTVSWRRETVQSPYFAGRVPVHEVKDAVESKLVVYVLGSSHAVLNTNIQTLIEAVTEQYRWELKLTIEGVLHSWDCERADYQIAVATETMNARFVPVNLSFVRNPTTYPAATP